MISHGKDLKIFSGNSNRALAEAICKELRLPLGDLECGHFSDGECFVSIYETVRGSDVFVIQSTCSPVNDSLMELLVMIDAFKRASAGRITAVIPYFGYARQDRKAKPRDPISAKLVANMLTTAGADRVLTMDLHAAQIQGFFDIPVDNLLGSPLFVDYFKARFGDDADNTMVVSPDVGSVARARSFAQKLGMSMAIVDKRRPKPNSSEVSSIIGDVQGKRVILLDDMVDTAGSLCGAAKALVELGGATEVFACASHGVLSGPALQRLEESVIKEVLFLDTIPGKPGVKSDKIKYLSDGHPCWPTPSALSIMRTRSPVCSSDTAGPVGRPEPGRPAGRSSQRIPPPVGGGIVLGRGSLFRFCFLRYCAYVFLEASRPRRVAGGGAGQSRPQV